MKKIAISIIFFLCMIVILSSCRNFNTYTIEGNIKGIASSNLVFVPYDEQGKNLATDTVKADVKGKFIFTGKSKGLSRIIVYMQNGSTWFTVWVKNREKVKVSGELSHPEMILVKGGQVNNALSSFKEKNKDILLQRNNLVQNYAFSSNDTSLYSIQKKEQFENMNRSLSKKAELLIERNPSSISSLVLIQDYLFGGEDPFTVKRYLSKISGEARKYSLYRKLYDANRKILSSYVGMKAPFFSVIGEKGKDITLNSYAGKYLLLIFTSSWSGQDYASYIRLRKKYGESRLGMLTIVLGGDYRAWHSSPEGKETIWDRYVAEDGWESGLVKSYNISKLPDNILIDKQKKIIEREIPQYMLEKILGKYLK